MSGIAPLSATSTSTFSVNDSTPPPPAVLPLLPALVSFLGWSLNSQEDSLKEEEKIDEGKKNRGKGDDRQQEERGDDGLKSSSSSNNKRERLNVAVSILVSLASSVSYLSNGGGSIRGSRGGGGGNGGDNDYSDGDDNDVDLRRHAMFLAKVGCRCEMKKDFCSL
jgi:hypothetical protein